MDFKRRKTALAGLISRRRISRSLATILAITLLQAVLPSQYPGAYAAAGNVGPSTSSGTCSAAVGETTYVTATFEVNTFCLIKFNTGTTWTVPTGVTAIDILVVGGGGGGGNDGGGGGGGGEVRQATGVSVTASSSASIAIGTGGAGKTLSGASSDGGQSSFVIGGTTYSANGGLKSVNWQPGAYYAPGGSGGSGGTQLTGGTDFSKGGRNSVQNDGYAAGGYGTVGFAGVTTLFTGTSTVFAGGGGGGICTNTKSEATFGGLAGGAGGGGRGALHTQNVGSDAGQPGTDGLGGGGGGGSACNDGGSDGVNARTSGGRGGNGVVYIKYIPVISITSNPSSVNGVIGTTTTFTASNAGTISGATRTKKWQVLVPGGSWTDIASSSSDSYTTPTITRAMHNNQYRYVVTDSAGTLVSTSNSAAATLTVIPPPQGDTDTAISKNGSYNYAFLREVGAEEVKALSGDNYTFEAWVLPTSNCSTGNGYCTIAGREGDWLLTVNNGELTFITYNATAWGSWQATGTNIPLNQWSYVALTKNSTTWSLYVNGVKTYSATLAYSPLASSAYYFYVGERWGAGYAFNGSIDEVRLWRTDRSTSIASDMTSTATNTAGLLAYWNFNEGSGYTAYNQVPGVKAVTDFNMEVNNLWDADVVSTQTQSGPYTVRTFKRSILTLNGGWKVPTGVTRISTLLVAGGGGGGGGLNGGGGGAGGFIETSTTVTPSAYYQIYVGAGGVGAMTGNLATTAPSNGTNSSAFSLTAIGGGKGGAEYNSPYAHYAPGSGGSGGGGNWGNNSSNYTGANGTSGQGNKGGDNLSNCCFGAGGGGAGAVGGNTTASAAGAGGAGKASLITGTTLAGGGGGSLRTSGNAIGTGGAGGSGGGGAGASSGSAIPNATGGPQSGSANTGGGGGAGVFQGATTDGKGAQGGTGVVVVRWITASKPTFTQPTTAYLNAGMTETFTTNVAADSATAILTRTFRWESSTTGVNGAYSLIKQGTGAANAAFSWIPQDTRTSGANFTYRVIVTDSDTLGLSIVETSTPVWAIINQPLSVSGTATIAKRINLSKNETFTITLGTSTYRPVLSPVIPGISLDTSTAGSAIIRISETMTVGTYYETLTVTDSVSASIITPLTITVTAPPNLLNTGEIVADSLTFHIEPGNSESLIGESGTATNGIVLKDLSGRGAHSTTGAGLNTGAKTTTTCTAPIYSSENAGVLKFDGDTCYYNSYSGSDLEKSYTAEMWFKVDGSIPLYGSFISQVWPTTSGNISFEIGRMNTSSGGIYVGFFDGTEWHYASCLFIPTVGTWAHIVGTYDGTSMKTYVNGSNTINGSACSVPFTGGFGATKNSQGMIIGKNWTGNNVYSFPFTLGSFRLYNKPLSGDQILQNYNATKNRFLTSNVDLSTPTHKYGNTTTETYTITSGYGAETISFATGNKAGVKLETTTSLVTLKMQESLTATTHYETITVTDSLGASTYLPIKMTVSKADTLTISMDTKTVVTFNGAPITSYPKPVIKGLAGLDTFTVTTKFSSSLYAKSSTVPTNADTYTVIAEDPVFGLGALSNYVNVVYETSTAVVNKAKQPSLSVFLYGGTVGQAFPITVLGGAGDGAISETVTAGSTMTGCTITNHSLTATSTNQGFCRVYIVKAASQNYLSESATVDMYFMAYINNQPTGQVGSGATIGLNGINSVETSTVQAPSITGLSTTSISLSGGGTLTITGTGFTGTVTVKFWRNKTINKTSGDSVTISVSAAELSTIGATTGRIAVITSNGEGVSVQTLTVTP